MCSTAIFCKLLTSRSLSMKRPTAMKPQSIPPEEGGTQKARNRKSVPPQNGGMHKTHNRQSNIGNRQFFCDPGAIRTRDLQLRRTFEIFEWAFLAVFRRLKLALTHLVQDQSNQMAATSPQCDISDLCQDNHTAPDFQQEIHRH